MRARALPTPALRRLRLTASLPPTIAGRLTLGLALATAAVAAFEYSPFGRVLEAGLASLEFDRARVAMIAAWIFCCLLALAAGALTARPWPSAIAASAYLCGTHAGPWAWRAATHPPLLFGSPERLDLAALVHNLATIVAVGFVVAVAAAAVGRQLGELVGVAPPLPAIRPVLRVVLLAAFMGAIVLTAFGTEPLVRYGPAHQVYHPAPRSAAASRGQVSVRVMHSLVLGADRPLAVYLPPSYRLTPGRRYPVVYLLHGSPGSYRDWLNLGIAGIADAGVATGSIAEAIVVMPDGNGRLNRPTQWADSHDGADRLESATIELVGQIDHEYRTLADPRHRVLAGLSEGGFGAVNLASRNPHLFGAAISLSGYFKAEGAAFGGNQALMHANSPSSTVREAASAHEVRFILVAGESDTPYLRGAEAFAAELDQLRVPHALFRLPGGHESWVWTTGLTLGLVELKSQMAGGR